MFSTTICGSSSRPAPYASSSCSIEAQRSAGSPSAASITWTSMRARSRCARNSWPEARALARTLDQARDVRDRELPAVGRIDRSEHGRDRRERILRDLRLRVRDPSQQRRLARVRLTDQRSVGQELQPQLEVALLAGKPDLGEARRLPCRRCEPAIAATARAASREHDARSRAREIRYELAVLEDLRPGGHAKLDGLT